MAKQKYCSDREQIQNAKPLPIIENPDGTIKKFQAMFNGYSITIHNYQQMLEVNTMGTFGKGNLSRNYPNNPEEVEILRNRVFQHRKQNFIAGQKPKKVLVVPDSDEENEDYFANLKVQYEIDKCGQIETLNLSLEEGFFLLSAIECLEIKNDGVVLDSKSAWRLFSSIDKNFVRNYVVYFYYRSRNWVVKTGIKFGGDFVLYKGNPQLHHANYVVVIDVVNENNVRYDDLSKNHMDVKYLHGVNRLCETAGKELLICQLTWPENLSVESPDDISKIMIKEVIMKRWISDANKDDDYFYLFLLTF